MPSCLLLEFEFSLVDIDVTYLIEFLSPLNVIENMFVLPAWNWVLPSNVKINKQLQLSAISKMEAGIFLTSSVYTSYHYNSLTDP